MHPEVWQRLKNVVQSALDEDRNSWPFLLFKTCGDDVELFLEAASLLAISQSVEHFIEKPAMDVLLGAKDG